MKRVYFLVSAVAVLLAACSSSSDSGGSPPPASPPPPPPNSSAMTVTTDNAKPAARVAYSATVQSVGTGDLVGGSGITANPGGFQKPGIEAATPGLLSRVVSSAPIGPITIDCEVSGTQTITGDQANPLTLSAGDEINTDVDNCDNGLGEVVDGRFEMTITLYSGDVLSGLYLLEADVDLIDFSITTATDAVTSNGDSSVSIDTLGSPTVTVGVSGNSLTTDSTLEGTQVLTGFDMSQTVNTGVFPETYTLSTMGRVNSSQLTGYVDFETPVTFQGQGDEYPFAGELLITGEGGGTIRLIALDAVNVRIETDLEGDGVVDDTEDTTWADIANELPPA